MPDPHTPNGKGRRATNNGLRLPSIKDLVAFSEGKFQASKAGITRRDAISDSLSDQASASYHGKLKSQFGSSRNVAVQGVPVEQGSGDRGSRVLQRELKHDREGRVNQAPHPSRLPSKQPPYSALREMVHLGHERPENNKRRRETRDYEPAIWARFRPASKALRQDEQIFITRPTSYPMKRTIQEQRQDPARPTSVALARSHPHAAPSRSPGHDLEASPSPTTSKLGQVSNGAPQPLRQGGVQRVTRPSVERSMARQPEAVSASKNALQLEQSHDFAPSPMGVCGQPFTPQHLISQSASTQPFERNRGATAFSHQQNHPQALTKPGLHHQRQFDYSCARLLDERGWFPMSGQGSNDPGCRTQSASSKLQLGHIAVQKGPVSRCTVLRDEVGTLPVASVARNPDRIAHSPRYRCNEPRAVNGHFSLSPAALTGPKGHSISPSGESRSTTLPTHQRLEEAHAPRQRRMIQVSDIPRPQFSDKAPDGPLAATSSETRCPLTTKVRHHPTNGQKHQHGNLFMRPVHSSPQHQQQQGGGRRQSMHSEARYAVTLQRRHREPLDALYDVRQQELKYRAQAHDERARKDHLDSAFRLRVQNVSPASYVVPLERTKRPELLTSNSSCTKTSMSEQVQPIESDASNLARSVLTYPRSAVSSEAGFVMSYGHHGRSPVATPPDVQHSRGYIPRERGHTSGGSRLYAVADRLVPPHHETHLRGSPLHGPTTSLPGSFGYQPPVGDASDVYVSRQSNQKGGQTMVVDITESRAQQQARQEGVNGVALRGCGHQTYPVPSTESDSNHKLQPLFQTRLLPKPTANHGTVPNTQTPIPADQHFFTAKSTPQRRAKRLRAGSDTSLVLKTSRFAFGSEQEALPAPSVPPSVSLRTNLVADRQRAGQDTFLGEETRYHTTEKQSATPHWPQNTSTGSAPITPPLSSN